MKKLILSVMLVLLSVCVVACSKSDTSNSSAGSVQEESAEKNSDVKSKVFEKKETLDEFGDPTRKYDIVTKKDLNGTFSTSDGSVKDAPLKWALYVHEDGTAEFEIKENGKISSLFLVDDMWDAMKMKVKYSDEETFTETVELIKNRDGVLNTLHLSEKYAWKYFSRIGETVKILISNDSGTYNLGSLDCDEFIKVCFPWISDAILAVLLQEEGEYGEALEICNNLPEVKMGNKGDVFDWFGISDCIEICKQKELLEQYLKDKNSVSLVVGWLGPAGGYIFYDCDADNENGNADGLKSSECGWRYLEAAPEDLPEKYVWGDDGRFETETKSGITYHIGADGRVERKAGITGIGEGRNETNIIVNKASNKREDNAAMACVVYAGGGYSDWFLPSTDELNLMYENLKKKGIGDFEDAYYWSTTYVGDMYAYVQNFGDGRLYSTGNRSYSNYVRPIRAFI